MTNTETNNARGTAFTAATDGDPGARYRFRAAIFDCDGLLVDSAAAWVRAFDQAAGSIGYGLSPGQHQALLGSSVTSAAEQITAWAGTPEQTDTLRGQVHTALRTAIRVHPPQACPGAAALLATLHRQLPMAVASNAPADVLADMLTASRLDGVFDAVLTAGQVERPKPEPDVYLAACVALGVVPADAVAFEDSHAGATAAQTAGLSLVIATTGSWPQITPLSWPADSRPVLYVPALTDPSVLAHLHDPVADQRPVDSDHGVAPWS
jgi:HAD superfamily hydrolase (TIGR01509 family)